MNQVSYSECISLSTQLPFPAETDEYHANFSSAFTDCLIGIAKAKCQESLDPIACSLGYIARFFSGFKQAYAKAASFSISRQISQMSADALMNYPDCTPSSCPDLDKKSVHPRALDAAKIISRVNYTDFLNFDYIPSEWTLEQEALRFRYDDIREKMLIVVAKEDHSGALKPRLVSSILATLASIYDVKYAVIENYESLCSLMSSAAKVGRFTNVIIMAHGNPNLIVLDKKGKGNTYKDYDFIANQDFSCFSSLAPHGKISLFSCSTGKEGQDGYPLANIAQKIADKTNRVVIAPKDLFYPFFASLLNPDKTVFFHPQNRLFYFLPFYNQNLLKPFHPHFKDCSSIDTQSLHEREVDASKIVHQEMIDNHLISDSHLNTPNDYLRTCRDNPKEKFLFLSALHSRNAFLKPEHTKGIMAGLANRFDFKFKVVRSYTEVCDEIDSAQNQGSLKGVILQSSSEKNQPAILDGNKLKDEHLNTTQNIQALTKCMSKIDEDGTFVFLGSSTASLPPHESKGFFASFNPFNNVKYKSLADQVAKQSKRTVIAPVCQVYAYDVHLKSTDPLIMHSPEYSFVSKYFLECNSSASNLFQEISP